MSPKLAYLGIDSPQLRERLALDLKSAYRVKAGDLRSLAGPHLSPQGVGLVVLELRRAALGAQSLPEIRRLFETLRANRPDGPIVAIGGLAEEEIPAELRPFLFPTGRALATYHRYAPERHGFLVEEIEGWAEAFRSREGRYPMEWTQGMPGLEDQAMERCQLASNAYFSQTPVLIQGETGSGKEVAAYHVINQSPLLATGRGRVFIMNVPEFSEALLASELFGHIQGAFTGADRDRSGIVEEAEDGVLFLDEIGEASLPVQAQLLRFIQSRTYRPVGSNKRKPARVWIIAATNRDLQAEVRAGRFREDLYHRLAAVQVALPPLRRWEPAAREQLAARLLQRMVGEERGFRGGLVNREVDAALSSDFIRTLHRAPLPGNVRELQHRLRGWVVTRWPQEVEVPAEVLISGEEAQGTAETDPLDPLFKGEDGSWRSFKDVSTEVERRYLAELSADVATQNEMAEIFGVGREAISRKLKRYGLKGR